jgi:hypothetical protein|tara:strand:+ start:86 stop:595 length:510 start_codon:yes stop_codon:yes gene_type:complete
MKISDLGVSVIPKREKGKGTGSAREPIFGKYIGESIAALQESIIEAERRFDRTNSEYDPADKSYGSVNWKVLAGTQGMSETVEVFWKVGRRSKVALFEDDAGNMVSTIRVRQSDVKGVLIKMLAIISDKYFEKTKEGALFHEAAIKAAKPTINRDKYIYKRGIDMYIKK